MHHCIKTWIARLGHYVLICMLFQIGDIGPGDYRLIARGSGGLSFETSTVLNYTKKSYSVFVQTDRAVYNPGSKILFRAVVLNSQLRPAAEVRNEPITVQISVMIFLRKIAIRYVCLCCMFLRQWNNGFCLYFNSKSFFKVKSKVESNMAVAIWRLLED